jgi:protein ImuB
VESEAVAGMKALSDLPLAALPLDQEHIVWFGRLGIFQVGQLAQLPKEALSSRLGSGALEVLQLIHGLDPLPLVAGEFARNIQEECSWEEPAVGISPLLFALHGLVAKISARLEGRGEACSRIECELQHDPAMARQLRAGAATVLDFDLATPLHHESDLERIMKTRLQACELLAPTIGMRIQVSQLTHQMHRQLGLNGTTTEASSHANGPWTQEFPVLAAELQADIGASCVGTLHTYPSHVPEDCSRFQPLFASSTVRTNKKLPKPRPSRSAHKLGLNPENERLTRLLPYPQRINVPLKVGETFALGSELYVIKELRFVRRLGEVKWWEESSVSRDYHWAWLRSAQGGTEALLFVDKKTGEGFVQAFCD